MKKFTLPKDGGLIEEGLPNGIKHTFEHIPAHIYATVNTGKDYIIFILKSENAKAHTVRGS